MENQEGNVRYYAVDNLVKCTLNDSTASCSSLGYSILDVLDSGLLQHDGTIEIQEDHDTSPMYVELVFESATYPEP